MPDRDTVSSSSVATQFLLLTGQKKFCLKKNKNKNCAKYRYSEYTVSSNTVLTSNRSKKVLFTPPPPQKKKDYAK